MGLTKTYPDGSTPTIAIIGAGISGLCAAIQLQRELQLTTYTVFELQSDLGGTWLTSTYPGCQSDAPIHVYSYSFVPNYNFSKKFAPQSEILAYLQATAKTYNIYDKIRFQTCISNIRWDEGRSKWILHWTKSATEEEGDYEADVVFHATGVLRVPSIPKDFDTFTGEKWHSANWNHSVDLSDKRVGIVGSSASGIQVTSAIGNKVKSLDVYGRSPAHITPQLDATYNRFWKFLFYYVPFILTFYRAVLFFYLDASVLLYQKMAWYSVFHRVFVYFVVWFHRFRQFPLDSKLRQKLTPEYELASRRIVLSDNFYPTLKLPHVSLHQSPISSINGNTIETSDGSKRELDVLIMATGFDRGSNFPDGYWTGRHGIEIKKYWNGNPKVYYSIWAPHAPNFFLMWGPNSGIAHHALTWVFESQVMQAIHALSYMMEHDLATMEAKQEAAEDYTKIIDRKMERTIFMTDKMPKFINQKGTCRAFWPGTATGYWRQMRKLHPECFHMVKRHRTSEKHVPNGVSHELKERKTK
ncbi:hypothetical protein BGX27_010717 [Mortierella sp. AM989]|nr:hypothetical protein BGX27_010717 [Mortierella sp. AM989]